MVSPVEKNDAAFVCERSPLLVTTFFLGYLQPIRTSISKMGNDVYYSPKPHPGFQNQRRSLQAPISAELQCVAPIHTRQSETLARRWVLGGTSARQQLLGASSTLREVGGGGCLSTRAAGHAGADAVGATAAASQFRYPHPDLAGETFINDRYGRGWRSVFPH
jgi:hypothetical protein